MFRIASLVVAVALAGCATQGPDYDWQLPEKQAIAIGNGALAAKNLEPSKYRWHQQVSRYTGTGEWFIEFSPRYPGPGGNDVLVVINDKSRQARVYPTDVRWSGGARTVVPEFGGLNGPLWR
jgi:hypothetical protein